LSEFERLLAEDVEEILLIRRAAIAIQSGLGRLPVENSVEYTARVPQGSGAAKDYPGAATAISR
jgi:hypothetical protein